LPKPGFFIVGAPRCGTTALSKFLGEHPEIFMAPKKGMHMFSKDLAFISSTTTNMETYLDEFEEAGEKLAGEASVWQIYSEQAPALIDKFNPTAKIIIMIRNPLDMVYSLHSRMVLDNVETQNDFEKAISLENERKKDVSPPYYGPRFRPVFYREAAKYNIHVKRYLDHFGADRVMVIVHDDLRTDPASVYKNTLAFLGVDDTFTPVFNEVNPNTNQRSALLAKIIRNMPGPVRKLKRVLMPNTASIAGKLETINKKQIERKKMAPEIRKSLSEEFVKDVQDLSGLLGKDLSGWLENQ
jgi:Sulfotransferase domain